MTDLTLVLIEFPDTHRIPVTSWDSTLNAWRAGCHYAGYIEYQNWRGSTIRRCYLDRNPGETEEKTLIKQYMEAKRLTHAAK